MSVFICWSGGRSKAIADALKPLLESVLPELTGRTPAAAHVFFSEDIEKGAEWFQAVRDKLNSSSAGIVVLTFQEQAERLDTLRSRSPGQEAVGRTRVGEPATAVSAAPRHQRRRARGAAGGVSGDEHDPRRHGTPGHRAGGGAREQAGSANRRQVRDRRRRVGALRSDVTRRRGAVGHAHCQSPVLLSTQDLRRAASRVRRPEMARTVRRRDGHPRAAETAPGTGRRGVRAARARPVPDAAVRSRPLRHGDSSTTRGKNNRSARRALF